jgi:site-specific recombinase XerC
MSCHGQTIASRALVLQQKTRRPVQFEITEPARDAVLAWIRYSRLKSEDFLYRRTKNLRAVQLLLGHSKLESTVRYLGIEVDDALEMAEQTEV